MLSIFHSPRVSLALAATLLIAHPLASQSDTPAVHQQRAKLLAQVQQVDHSGPFAPSWDSLAHYQIPDWYRDAKFGIFIHWGVYSVPAFANEWYPRNMYQKDSREYKHQVATYGPETQFGYKDFIPQFTAKNFDPQAWAKLFKASGARYVIPVAEHHDGFAMYDSDLSEWTAVKMGPKRDVVGQIAQAVRAEGLHFGLSTHREEHYWFFDGGFLYPSDVQSQKYASLYGYPVPAGQVQNIDVAKDTTIPPKLFLQDWLARDAELIEKYKPDVVYFDWWINKPQYAPYLQRFAAFYYNYAAAHQGTAVINYKQQAMPEGTAVLDVERGQLAGTRALAWQTDTSISDQSWGYVEHDTYKQPGALIQQLADIVSKNGNLLLNIGPRSDGTIPEPVQRTLFGMGRWLSMNGDAIYGTRPWTQFGEGPTQVAAGSFHDTQTQPYTAADFRFTTHFDKDEKDLYAIEMARPEDDWAVIQALNAKTGPQVRDVHLLGYAGNLEWKQQADGLHIHLPADVRDEYAYAYRIVLQ